MGFGEFTQGTVEAKKEENQKKSFYIHVPSFGVYCKSLGLFQLSPGSRVNRHGLPHLSLRPCAASAVAAGVQLEAVFKLSLSGHMLCRDFVRKAEELASFSCCIPRRLLCSMLGNSRSSIPLPGRRCCYLACTGLPRVRTRRTCCGLHASSVPRWDRLFFCSQGKTDAFHEMRSKQSGFHFAAYLGTSGVPRSSGEHQANLVPSGIQEASDGASIHRCQPGNVGVPRSIRLGEHPSLPTW